MRIGSKKAKLGIKYAINDNDEINEKPEINQSTDKVKWVINGSWAEVECLEGFPEWVFPQFSGFAWTGWLIWHMAQVSSFNCSPFISFLSPVSIAIYWASWPISILLQKSICQKDVLLSFPLFLSSLLSPSAQSMLLLCFDLLVRASFSRVLLIFKKKAGIIASFFLYQLTMLLLDS